MIDKEPKFEDVRNGFSFFYVKRPDAEGIIAYLKQNNEVFSVSFAWAPEDGLDAAKLEAFLNTRITSVMEEMAYKIIEFNK